MFDIELVSNKNKPKSLIVSGSTKIDFIKKKYGFEDNIELIYKGQILEDDACLQDYNIVDDAQLFVIFLNTYIAPIESSGNGTDLITNLISILNAYNNDEAANNRNYESELNQLETMGFGDREQNRRLLILYRGNMEETISALIG
jgi:hypothetical protein